MLTAGELSPGLVDAYLRVLGVPARAPSLDALRELVGAHLARVPFENISKLLARKRGADFIPSLEEYLDGIARHGFGGTCYATNLHLHVLLRELGYDVALCGADMSVPDVHIVNLVRVEGRELLVDVGYAAPFFAPLPRDLDRDHVVSFGSERYVLHPRAADGRSRLDLYREGARIHGYVVNPEARGLVHFDRVIRESYGAAATFQNAVVAVRFAPGRSLRIHNLSLTESTPEGAARTRLADRRALIDAVVHHFGMPRVLVETAVGGVPLAGDIYT